MTEPLADQPPAPSADALAIFLDVDGTLIELSDHPTGVLVSDALRGLITALQDATNGAVALVSGRSIAQLDDLFGPLRFAAAGLHGLERRDPDGRRSSSGSAPPALDDARAALRAFASANPGVLVEDKAGTVALHYRNAPQHEAAARELVDGIVAASDGTVELLSGKMVLEIKPPNIDKGQAIASFMEDPPFRGRRPVFAGDDLTDEAGFVAVNRLDGISIGVGEIDRPCAARYRLPSVAAVHRWLAATLPK